MITTYKDYAHDDYFDEMRICYCNAKSFLLEIDNGQWEMSFEIILKEIEIVCNSTIK